MPVIRIDIGKHSATAEIKVELIEKLTRTASEVTKIPADVFSVIIYEHEDNNYGVGGKTLDKVRKQ